MPYLIDTDIIIYSLKNNPAVRKNFLKYELVPKGISIITYGELLIGAKKSMYIDKNLAIVYRVRDLFPVFEIDLPIIETFSNLKTALHRRGSPIDDMDLLIAATALTLNFILVTNNEKHFRKIEGLVVENWSCE